MTAAEVWEDLRHTGTVHDVIKSVTMLPFDHAIEYSPQCDGYSNSWKFEDGRILGPPCSPINHLTSEQWTNHWMRKLHAELKTKSIVTDAHYRFVNFEENSEFEAAEKGCFRLSQNNNKTSENYGKPETGKSVIFAPLWIYFKDAAFAFMLSGTLLEDTCSDDAPLLDVNQNIELVSPRMNFCDLLTCYYDTNKTIFQDLSSNSQVPEDKIFAVSLGLWDNYWPDTVFPVPDNDCK